NVKEYELFSKMLSKTVHDINNPLAVVIGQASIMEMLIQKDKLTPEKLEKIIAKFKSSTEVFKDRLSQLRGFYKVPMNDPDYSKLTQLLESVCYYFDGDCSHGGITLNFTGDTDYEIDFKTSELFIILKSLVQNSMEAIIDHNKDNGGSITINCEKREQNIVVKVIDSGPGLVCELPIACEPGYTTKSLNHPGLGLSMVQHLLNQKNLLLHYGISDAVEFSITFSTK
ncbi:MAG: HAMP domain-containing histidine kinase, partial [Halobacteriovoraceae bacterium]|nr:HAMP domain-containing histidine kinase [Halobacteriovoraceae bacterium]